MIFLLLNYDFLRRCLCFERIRFMGVRIIRWSFCLLLLLTRFVPLFSKGFLLRFLQIVLSIFRNF